MSVRRPIHFSHKSRERTNLKHHIILLVVVVVNGILIDSILHFKKHIYVRSK